MLDKNQIQTLWKISSYFKEMVQSFQPYPDNKSFVRSLKRIGIGLGTAISVLLKTICILMLSLPFILIAAISAKNLPDFKKKLLFSSSDVPIPNYLRFAILAYMLYISLVNLFQIFVIPIRLVVSAIHWFKEKNINNEETFKAPEDPFMDTNYLMPLWNENKNLNDYIFELFFFKNNSKTLQDPFYFKHQNLHSLNYTMHKEFSSIFALQHIKKYLALYNNKEQIKNDFFEILKSIRCGINSLLVFLFTFLQYPILIVDLFFTSYTWSEVSHHIKKINNTTAYQLFATISLAILYFSRLHTIITIPVKGIIFIIMNYCFSSETEEKKSINPSLYNSLKSSDNLELKKTVSKTKEPDITTQPKNKGKTDFIASILDTGIQSEEDQNNFHHLN